MYIVKSLTVITSLLLATRYTDVCTSALDTRHTSGEERISGVTVEGIRRGQTHIFITYDINSKYNCDDINYLHTRN